MRYIQKIPGLAGAVSAAMPLAGLAALGGLMCTTPGLAQHTCIVDWSEAGPIVRREGLASIEQVGRLVRDRRSGEVVTSALCRAEDRYYYRLTVRAEHGTLRTVVVDARKPFDP